MPIAPNCRYGRRHCRLSSSHFLPHDLTPADLKPYLGAVSRVSEIRNGTKGFTLKQIRRLHRAYHIPADVLIAEPA